MWKAVLDAEKAKEQGVDMEDEESEEEEEDIEFVEEEDLEDEDDVGMKQFVDDDSQYESDEEEDMEDARGGDEVSQPPHWFFLYSYLLTGRIG